MLSYIVRRIASTIPVVVMVALFVFSLLYIAPGDPAAIIAGDQATPADVDAYTPSISADGKRLVAAISRDGKRQIAAIDLASHSLTPLTDDDADHQRTRDRSPQAQNEECSQDHRDDG